MPHVRTQHPNASLTPLGRRKMVRLVIDHGWTIEATRLASVLVTGLVDV